MKASENYAFLKTLAHKRTGCTSVLIITWWDAALWILRNMMYCLYSSRYMDVQGCHVKQWNLAHDSVHKLPARIVDVSHFYVHIPSGILVHAQ